MLPPVDEPKLVNRVLKALRDRDSYTALLGSRQLANSQIAGESPLHPVNVTVADLEYLYKRVESFIRRCKYADAVSYLEKIRLLEKLAKSISYD